jgi:hypothetical protein
VQTMTSTLSLGASFTRTISSSNQVSPASVFSESWSISGNGTGRTLTLQAQLSARESVPERAHLGTANSDISCRQRAARKPAERVPDYTLHGAIRSGVALLAISIASVLLSRTT